MSAYGFTINADGNSIQVMKQIEASLSSMGIKAKVEAHKVESAFSGMGAKIKSVMSEYKGLILGGLAAGGIWGGIEFIKSSIEAYDKLEKAITRVNTVIQSTHGAAGVSGNMVEEQAKSLSKGILQSRSEIMDAQGMLLSFTGIRGPIFAETTKAVADFATFYKTDMTSAALAIGKAMNDPAKGMNRLQRMGVAFTDEQKKQVKLYEQQGHLALAQGVILKELKTEFGGQAAAATTTDEGKVQMAAKQWGSLKLMLGEVFSKIQVSLIPAFNSLVKYIKEAFESTPIQFFLEHLKDVVAIALKLIPIWLGYKGVMLAINTAKSTYAVISRALTTTVVSEAVATNAATMATVGLARAQGGAAAAMAEEAAAAEAATVSTSGFGAAVASTGIGALVIALGLAIEKFIQWNSEIDETVDKLTNVKEITQGFKASEDAVEKISLAMSGAQTATQKSGVLADINNKIKEIQDKIDLETRPSLDKTKKLADSTEDKNPSGWWSFLKIGAMSQVGVNISNTKEREHSGIVDATKKIQQAVGGYTEELKKLQAMQKTLLDQKVKPLKYTPAGAIQESALKTTGLTGAQGGLGEAKVINIRIDTMQKVSVANGSGWKDASQNASEILLRTLNNIAYSQSRTM